MENEGEGQPKETETTFGMIERLQEEGEMSYEEALSRVSQAQKSQQGERWSNPDFVGQGGASSPEAQQQQDEQQNPTRHTGLLARLRR